MKLFVTGGTGFIGSHFIEQALAVGCEVTALRRAPTSRPRFTLPQQPNWLDRGMDELSVQDLAGYDVFVHLAAHTVNVPYDSLEQCMHWNLTVPLSTMQKADRAGIGRFVVAGSCFEYGRAGERYEYIPIDAPLEATQSYAASKAAASIAFAAFAAESKVQLSIHRIFQVFGKGEAPTRLWPSLRRAALAGYDYELTPGEQIRDFIPVEDVASKLLTACADERVTPGVASITNLGCGRPQSVREFAEYWWNHWQARGKLLFGALPYREGEVMRYVPQVEPAAMASLVS